VTVASGDRKAAFLGKLCFGIGLMAVFAYWLHLRPEAGSLLGYSGDLGTIELTRQVIADNLRDAGRPLFLTDRLMAPTGTSAVYFSWALERDWLGAYAWIWNRDFPWLWAYFGLSLLISYLGVGWLSRKMGLPRPAAWGLAAAIVVFNIPRHLKTYHHYEHTIHHWVYLGIFLDAWIWQRFWREKRLSWNLELWRFLLLGAAFNLSGYYWGAMMLEWGIVRACMALSILKQRSLKKLDLTHDWSLRRAIAPLALGAALVSIQLQWFLPLLKEMRALPEIRHDSGWPASLALVFRPIWGDGIFLWVERQLPWFSFLQLAPFDMPETIVTVGWIYWIPILWATATLRKKNGGPGLGILRPFIAFLVTAMIYFGGSAFLLFQDAIQAVVPFMKYFRVTSRMGLCMVPTLGATLALLWPVLEQKARSNWSSWAFRAALALFAASSLTELSYIATQATIAPRMQAPFRAMLDELKDMPGSTVLDLPFCVIGGNGGCPDEQCPGYPMSTAAATLTAWHGKKVYGIYLARLTGPQCDLYRQTPYLSWFSAWNEQRCFTEPEWDGFCSYLEQRTELAGVLVYPGIWTAARQPGCRAQIEARLGAPLKEAEFVAKIERGNTDIQTTSVLLFPPRCANMKAAL
jgi:hypothetical protein